MVFDIQDNIFMLAGPVKIHPRVLKAMNTPSIGHRSPEFSEVNAELRE
ncbi:MAG TPA: aminotransferase, partial [Thermoplasmatales archaeon]|nr:aminotransferase [Thermoplasmatales archaeon]